MIQQEEQNIYWDDVFGNPFLVTINPEMLTDKGFTSKKIAKIKGHSKKIGVPVTILYDRQYVYRFVAQKIIIPLGITKFNEMQSIVALAWNEYKKENKQ